MEGGTSIQLVGSDRLDKNGVEGGIKVFVNGDGWSEFTAERIGCVRFMGIFNSFVNFGTVWSRGALWPRSDISPYVVWGQGKGPS